ncbi:hypothetical protein [Spirosoma harenae]
MRLSPELLGILLFPVAAYGLYWLYRKFSFSRKCPACGDTSPERIPRPAFVRNLLGFLPLQHLRCLVCRHRFYYLGKKTA